MVKTFVFVSFIRRVLWLIFSILSLRYCYCYCFCSNAANVLFVCLFFNSQKISTNQVYVDETTKHRLVPSICIMRFSSFNSIQWSFVVVVVVFDVFAILFHHVHFNFYKTQTISIPNKLCVAAILSKYVFHTNELYCASLAKSIQEFNIFS